jgi:hypothetical protein
MANQVLRPTTTARAVALEQAFVAIYQGQQPDSAHLQEAICAFTDAMKAEGWQAERVIIQVKAAASHALMSVRRHSPSSSEPTSQTEEIIAEAVRWCIDDYYEDKKGK